MVKKGGATTTTNRERRKTCNKKKLAVIYRFVIIFNKSYIAKKRDGYICRKNKRTILLLYFLVNSYQNIPI